MCRNIKPLFNFDPPATAQEIHAASLQYVRKVSGMNKPSVANQEEFDTAVDQIAAVTKKLMNELSTSAAHKNRAEEAEKARARFAKRFSK